MDRIQEASNVIVEINKYRKGNIKDHDLIKTICGYFDKIKNEKITQSDKKFLKYISNVIGIPHYYDLLSKFQQRDLDVFDFDLNTFSSVLYESTLHTSEHIKLHKYQKNIIDKFEKGKLNRFVLSASTSFGKTFLVYEIIKKMDYKNILLIFPTIALLSENHELIRDDKFSHFKKFKVHTLSEVENLKNEKCNLFIYTPERFLSFIEKRDHNFDFAFVDEFYKIDNDYIIDDSVQENERDVAYRIALQKILIKSNDVLLAGPYIEFADDKPSSNYSFNNFMENNNFELLNRNQYEVVNKTTKEIKAATITLDENIKINFNSTRKTDRLITIIYELNKIRENCIVYCSRKCDVESYAEKIVDSKILAGADLSKGNTLIEHLEKKYREDWIVIRALKHGIGIHHGSVPKYIQKEIIKLFNDSYLKVILSTTTITEGVNTSAKNVIVLHDKKGKKPLKTFDTKNIGGRAGRFQKHYSGRVIVLGNNFNKIEKLPVEVIRHKNYDIESPKDEIDLFFTRDEYLNDSDQNNKRKIQKEQLSRNIPENIMNLYTVVSRNDKIAIYDSITKIHDIEEKAILKLIQSINSYGKVNIDYQGFQTIINIILPIVKNENLKSLINFKSVSRFDSLEYSVLTHLVYFYLRDGFMGSVRFKLNRGKKIDPAIRETADFIYNTLKYHLVKYLGVFNVMYKFHKSQIRNIEFEEVYGIDKLLTKLEYNAVSLEGRQASDYGVPAKIVEYYDNTDNRAKIQSEFDEYESQVFEKVKKIINE